MDKGTRVQSIQTGEIGVIEEHEFPWSPEDKTGRVFVRMEKGGLGYWFHQFQVEAI